jgi:hypothetical protein
MSDELRDEYQFDYRQAKPNRFAAVIKKDGRLVMPAQSEPTSGPGVGASQGQSHTELSDEQKHLLEDLYAGVSVSVDDLPYTEEMEHIHRDFVQQSGLSLTIRDVYKALKNLGRQGRLGGKFRSPQG